MCIEQLYIEPHVMSHFYASNFFMILLIVFGIFLKYVITSSALS